MASNVLFCRWTAMGDHIVLESSNSRLLEEMRR